MRRYLRLYPVLLWVLGAAAAGKVEYAREAFLAHLSFTTNWWIFITEEWPGRFSALWSLG